MSSSAKKTASRKLSAKPARKSGTPGATGNLTNPEKTKLLLQAKDAWQKADPHTPFDQWRTEQVMEAVGLAGISKLNRSHWRTVMAHFLIIAGKEDEAFKLLNATGKKTYRPTNSLDTWETSETYVHHICTALADHLQTSQQDLQPGKGHILTEWFLHAARQRTGKPSLTMDTLAERVDPETLHGLLSHLRNHISRREGREDPTLRKPRIYPAKPESNDPF